jgi:8-oxo-dGTP diphosphatase
VNPAGPTRKQTDGHTSLSTAIRIAAAVIVDADGRLLLVRKRGTLFFMQPGGKLESGETMLETLARELKEELGCVLHRAEFLGNFNAPAANEKSRAVEASLFHAEIAGDITPGAEIEEIAWVKAPAENALPLAPLTETQIFPFVQSRGLALRNLPEFARKQEKKVTSICFTSGRILMAEHYAHVLLFSCPQCGGPLASACASTKRNLEQAEAHWFTPRCHCGWTGDTLGVIAVQHWVEPWAEPPRVEATKCDGEPLSS